MNANRSYRNSKMKTNEEEIEENKDKIISKLAIDYFTDTLLFEFADGSSMSIKDKAGYCCEKRSMSCDDDLYDFIGSRFLDVIEKECEIKEEDRYIVHQIMFLEIVTSKGSFTLTFHNVSNGYYMGFDPVIESVSLECE